MKYEEYQVWFHAFNNAIAARLQIKDLSVYQCIEDADAVANTVLTKFKTVETPEPVLPEGLGGIDLKNVVNQVAKEVMKERLKK